MSWVSKGGDGGDSTHGPVCTEEGRRQEEPQVDRGQVEPVKLAVGTGECHSRVIMATNIIMRSKRMQDMYSVDCEYSQLSKMMLYKHQSFYITSQIYFLL